MFFRLGFATKYAAYRMVEATIENRILIRRNKRIALDNDYPTNQLLAEFHCHT
jgi:hypothetical protein